MAAAAMKSLSLTLVSDKIIPALMLYVVQDFKSNYASGKGGTGLSSLLTKLNTNAAIKAPPKQAIK